MRENELPLRDTACNVSDCDAGHAMMRAPSQEMANLKRRTTRSRGSDDMKIGRLTAASVSIASMLALTACSTVGGTTGDSSSSNTGSAAGDSGKTMVTVVKVKGIAWFDRMDVGVKEWGAENG